MEANAFVGPLPSSFASSNITQLFLQDNQLTGQLTFLGDDAVVGSLIVVDLSLNQFTGQVPGQLVNANNMVFFNVSINDLTGEMPSGLVDLLTPMGKLDDLSADCTQDNAKVDCQFCTFCT
jgi:hypothetical protein